MRNYHFLYFYDEEQTVNPDGTSHLKPIVIIATAFFKWVPGWFTSVCKWIIRHAIDLGNLTSHPLIFYWQPLWWIAVLRQYYKAKAHSVVKKAVKIQKISRNSFGSLNITVYEEWRRIVIVKDSKQDINHSGLVISLLIYIRYKIVRVRKKTKQPTLTWQ